uniref:Large ribosomal subunit protein eL22 n=1 Tax=Ditylenchus dipsaci TaxID=166011 RepID=A0A915E040_9BILA
MVVPKAKSSGKGAVKPAAAVAKPAEPKAAGAQPVDDKSAAKKTAKPAAKSVAQAAEAKPAAPKPAGVKPAEAKPVAAKPAVVKSTANKVKPKLRTATKQIIKKTTTGAAGKKKKKQVLQFHIECKNPVEDGILKISDFETFLHDKIKVGGKTKQLAANGVQVEAAKTMISVTSDNAFSKRYLKYLTKKYLKRSELRDWIRVVATAKDTYELRYFQINQEDEEDSDNEA